MDTFVLEDDVFKTIKRVFKCREHTPFPIEEDEDKNEEEILPAYDRHFGNLLGNLS